MDSLSAHGLRGSYDPSRRGFLITMFGAGVMLGYARCGLAAVEGIVSGAQRASSASELFEPTIWYGIDPRGEVTINVKRAEMGHMSALRGSYRGRRVRGRLGKGSCHHSSIRRCETGRNGHRRQLVGVAEFSGAQPGGRRGPFCSDRRRRQTARR